MSMGLILITGGTRGIGAATARKLAGSSSCLVLTYRADEESAAAMAAELGARAVVRRCDVADPEQVADLFAEIDRLGTLTGVVNNAGVLEQQCEFTAIDQQRWQRVFATNVFGLAEVCRHAVLRMRRTGGAIVNLSSRAAQLGSPGEYVDYAASKAAVETLTRGLALELAADGIRVNAVRPGLITTDMHALGGDPDRAERAGRQQPMGRPGTPQEIAEAVAWLLSDAASYVTGAFLDVSGGR